MNISDFSFRRKACAIITGLSGGLLGTWVVNNIIPYYNPELSRLLYLSGVGTGAIFGALPGWYIHEIVRFMKRIITWFFNLQNLKSIPGFVYYYIAKRISLHPINWVCFKSKKHALLSSHGFGSIIGLLFGVLALDRFIDSQGFYYLMFVAQGVRKAEIILFINILAFSTIIITTVILVMGGVKYISLGKKSDVFDEDLAEKRYSYLLDDKPITTLNLVFLFFIELLSKFIGVIIAVVFFFLLIPWVGSLALFFIILFIFLIMTQILTGIIHGLSSLSVKATILCSVVVTVVLGYFFMPAMYGAQGYALAFVMGLCCMGVIELSFLQLRTLVGEFTFLNGFWLGNVYKKIVPTIQFMRDLYLNPFNKIYSALGFVQSD